MSEYDELKSRLDELESRQEIERLIINYGKAADAVNGKKDYDLFVSLFSEDCVYTNPKFGFKLEGNSDKTPVFDKNDPRKMVKPGGVGWLFNNVILPNQEDYCSLIANITIDIDGDTATGSDHMIRYGYKRPKPSDPTPQDLEFTYALHRFKFTRINKTWKISWFEGNPIHNPGWLKK